MDSANLNPWELAVSWLRTQPDSERLVRACYFDDPIIEAAARFTASSEWSALRPYLGSVSGQALDVGAGRGISSFALAQSGWDVTALEPNPSGLVGSGAIQSLAKSARMNINVVTDWGEKLPFADNAFDLVYCRQVLHHARNLSQLCAEMGRVLKPGGLFVATREHVISRRSDLDRFLASHPLHARYGGENAFLLSEYLAAIRAAGVSLRHVLNPLESDINLFPDTSDQLRKRWVAKLRLPSEALLPKNVVKLIGRLSTTPGRLYTFIGVRTRNG